MYKNMEELIKDEELLISLVEAKTADEFAALLEEKGVAIEGITKEEAFEAFHSQEGSDELSEENLDDVAGGIVFSTIAVVSSAAMCTSLASFAYGYYKLTSKRKRR